MRGIIVMPLHDPSGLTFAHLREIMPALQNLFAGACVGVTAVTAAAQPEQVAWLAQEGFFKLLIHPAGLAVGDQFRELYAGAAAACDPGQLLHLCFSDRLIYIFQSGHRESFAADIRAIQPEETPLIFQRSEAAWETHPRNYRATERMVTTAGELLFGQTLDFAWCHLVVRGGQLAEIMSRVHRPDMSMVAEMVLQLMSKPIRTKDADWLAWEDPFMKGCDTWELRQEREASVHETRKRLAYVIPMLQLLYAAADSGK